MKALTLIVENGADVVMKYRDISELGWPNKRMCKGGILKLTYELGEKISKAEIAYGERFKLTLQIKDCPQQVLCDAVSHGYYLELIVPIVFEDIPKKDLREGIKEIIERYEAMYTFDLTSKAIITDLKKLIK